MSARSNRKPKTTESTASASSHVRFWHWEGPIGVLRQRPLWAVAASSLALVGLIGAVVLIWPQVQALNAWRAAQHALAEYDFVRARHELEKCANAWPHSAETYFLLARTARRAGDYDAARHYLQRAEQIGWVSDSIDLEYILARAQQGAAHEVHAVLWRNIEAGHPDRLLILEAMVKGYLQTYRLNEAALCLNKWVELAPEDWVPRYWRAMTLERGHRRGEAAEDYLFVLDKRPDHAQARLRLAEILRQQGRGFKKKGYEEAEEHYRKYLEQHPQDAEALVGLARCLREQARFDEARTCLTTVLQQQPDHALANMVLGQIEFDTDLSPAGARRALSYFLAAEKQIPWELDVAYGLQRVYYRLGDKEQAEAYRRKVEQLMHDQKMLNHLTGALIDKQKDAGLRYEIGLIFMRSGQEFEGLRWLLTALQDDPDHVPTHRALATYYEKAGERTRAAFHRRMAERGSGQKFEEKHDSR
ncbi:MAG: hypothetical protein C4296_05015 [Gemmataceae bacterium]